MTIRKSLIISTSIHLLLILCLVIPIFRLNIDFDIKQGVSSLSINIVNSKKSREIKKDEKRRKAVKELNVLLSPYGFYNIAYADAKKKKVNDFEKNKKAKKYNTRDSKVSKSVIGAFCRKASRISRNQPPEYPYLARKMGYQGKVILGIEILPSGKIGEVNIQKSSGYNILDRSAVNAAKRWRLFEKDEYNLVKSVLITQGLEFIIRR